MLSNKTVLQFYTKSKKQISVADGHSIVAEGQGSMLLDIGKNQLGKFDNVLHCSKLFTGLLSVGRLDAGSNGFVGHVSLFINGKYLVFPNTKLRTFVCNNEDSAIITGKQGDDLLYYVTLNCNNKFNNNTPSHSYITRKTRTITDLHISFGYLNQEDLIKLQKSHALGIEGPIPRHLTVLHAA
jgi:hypothetical protein